VRLGGPAEGKLMAVCPLGVTEGGETVSPGSAGHICGLAAVGEARSHQEFLAEVGDPPCVAVASFGSHLR
jgi:hypothetical protein